MTLLPQVWRDSVQVTSREIRYFDKSKSSTIQMKSLIPLTYQHIQQKMASVMYMFCSFLVAYPQVVEEHQEPARIC